MKDPRVTTFRKALEGLVDSLDATLRLKEWSETEDAPDPLRESASQLVTRLATAGRMASGHFSGSVADVARVSTMLGAMRRLDAAYVVYRHRLGGSVTEQDHAVTALRSEIDEARTGAL